MPIPTDTYRNVKILNWLFAGSALLLTGVMLLSVVQDYHKSWREPQISDRVWEAALVDDNLRRADTPEKKQELDRLADDIKARQKEIDANSAKIDDLKNRIAKIRSDASTLEFGLNNRKAELAVSEAQLEEARTSAGTDEDRRRVRELETQIRSPRQRVADDTEKVKAWGVDVEKLTEELNALTRDRDALQKERTRLLVDETALKKKREALQPRRLDGRLSAQMRRIPLMQFINPSEKVTQDVLPDVRTDVAFQKITTIDRCRTCHVNIEDPNFSEENILTFLERNVAGSRQMALPAARPTRATEPRATTDEPGPAAMGEFWHGWALQLGPPAVRRNAARIKSIADTVGKGVTLTVDGRPVPAFAYDLNAAIAQPSSDLNRTFAVLLQAWSRFPVQAGTDKAATAVDLSMDRIRVQITHGAASAPAVRAAALKYPEDVRAYFDQQLEKDQRRLLLDRYRRDLTEIVNVYRDRQGEPGLDPGRVMLAHPNLDLYVSVDSKHSYEKVGCTSCHDGSGQETDFVLTAHTARDIWVDQKTGAAVLPEQVLNPPAAHETPTLSSMLQAVFPHDALAPTGASSLHLLLGGQGKDHRAGNGHPSEPAAPVERAPQAGRLNGSGGAPVQLASADSKAAAGAVGSTGTSAGANLSVTNPSPLNAALASHMGNTHGKAGAPAADAKPVNYRDPVTGETGRAVPQIQYWAKKYELESGDSFKTVHHRWDWPMRAAQHVEANCVRCHTQVSDIREYAPTLNEGRTLFASIGCSNCHQMDSIPAEQKRQVGPDLRHVADKLSPAFINTWVWAPKAFRPSTKMPHFFMLENNSGDEELRRTRQEARAITEYLVRSSAPMLERHPIPSSGKGSADAGQQLFETVGCQGCHVNLNAPTKTRGVTVAQQWITTDLIKAGKLAERIEPVVARELAERMTRDVAVTAEKAIETSVTSTVTAAVTKELTPVRAAGAPRATPAEQAALKAKIAAEVKKRLPAELAKAKTGLPSAIEKARGELPAAIERGTPAELTRRVAQEAKAIYDAMSYNERQLYISEKFEPTTVLLEPKVAMPGRAFEADPSEQYVPQTYPDGTPKPVFMHHGPELSGVGTKLLAGRTPEEARSWLFAWLREPQHYSSYTLMPNLRLTDQQALDLTEYLLAQTRESNKPGDAWKAEVTPPDGAKLSELLAFFLRSRFSVKTAEQKAVEEWVVDGTGKQSPGEVTKLAVDALITPITPRDEAAKKVDGMTLVDKQMVYLGKKLVSHYGCMSCHQINGMETATSPCANLSDWGQKGLDKLDFAYLDAHKAHSLPETHDIPMVNGLSEHAAVLGHSADFRPDGKGKVAQPVSVGWPHVGHSREDWITQKLGNTRIYDRGKNLLDPAPARRPDGQLENPGRPYDKLRMPTFYLSDKQIAAIVTFVISNRDRLVTDTITMKGTTDESRQIAFGRYLTQKYNCVACHQTERNSPPVQQYYTREDLTTKAPPSLRGEGNKIHHDWLFNFLKNVEPLRPLPQIRMPSFHFDNDAEVTAIAAYFAAVSNKESRELKARLDAVLAVAEPKKPVGAPGLVMPSAATTAPAPSTQPVAALGAPTGSANTQVAGQAGGAKPLAAATAKAPWYRDETLASQRKWLEDWALNRKQLIPIQLNPSQSATELEKGYATLLFKARFTAGLYDAPYPFAEDSRPTVTPERLKKGEQLFYEMQCLKCHMFGEFDPNEKAPAGVVAPNLALANERLQRRWVRHWVQEPPIIQVGTAMPPYLSGITALKLDGLSWPVSQQLNPQETQRIEQAYGSDPNEQASLVLDFLYWAGARNMTLSQPQAGAGAPSATGAGPTPLPKGAPATPSRPNSAGDPSVGSPANADVNKAPVQPGTNVVPPEQKQQMLNPVKPAQGNTKPQAVVPTSPTVPTERPAPAPAPVPIPQPAAAPPAQAGAPSVTGKIVFNGEAPEPEQIDMGAVKECAAHHPDGAFAESLVVNENKTLRDVVVSVTSGLPEGGTYPVPPPARLDQKGCQYHPHVLAVMKDQPLVIANSDPFLHNVHSLAVDNPAFNFGQPNIDPGRKIDPMKAAEVFKIKCDVHPWMGAFVHVMEHPFFSVTGDDGTFALRGLPPGKYTLTARHETLGTKTAEVTVEAGKPAAADISFDAPQ